MWTKFLAWIKSFFSKPEVKPPTPITPVPTTPVGKSKINRTAFFNSVRGNFGRLAQSQVDGFSKILDTWDDYKLTDLRWLAYMLATSWHETAQKMQAISEYGRGQGHTYGVADPVTGFVYYGRGLVQLTWADNYKKMGKLLGIQLYENPTLALELETAVKILFEGMIRGSFTGKALVNYFNGSIDDPVGARRIINGTDKAGLIAGYHSKFLAALTVK